MVGAARRRSRVVAPPPDDEPSASRSSAAARDTDNVEDNRTTIAEERQNTQYMKTLSRVYKTLMPYMRKYKNNILACWEDGEHTFRLQRMPFQIQDIQYTTTCGHPYCPLADGIMEPGTFRVSIEPNEHSDSEVDWSQIIPLKPLRNFTAAWTQWPDGYGSKGTGKEVKHWLCLTCLEDLWMEGSGFDDTADENLELPKMGDLSILQPETRTRGPKNKLYNLSSPYVYALAKWAAVIRHQDYIDPLHKSEAARCYEGEPGTLYEDPQTLNMHGIDEVTGARIEISADLIRSPATVKFGTRPIKFLSEVLDWVDEEVSKVRQEMAGSSRTPKAISENLRHVSKYLHAKKNDSYSKIADEATSLATGDETEDEDEPVAQPSVQVTPHRQRRSAFTTANKALLKSRARDSPEHRISELSSSLSSLDDKPHRQRRPAFTTPNKIPLKSRARGSQEVTSSELSSALSSPDDNVVSVSSTALSSPDDKEVDIAPKPSEKVILLSSSEEEPLADVVSPAGPAATRASKNFSWYVGDDGKKTIFRTNSKSKTQTKVKKKTSQKIPRRESKVPKTDKPSQGRLGNP